MTKKCCAFVCLVLCAVCLCSCGLGSFSTQSTIEYLREKDFVLMNRTPGSTLISNTNFYVFSAELGNISQNVLSNFYPSQFSYFPEVYKDFALTFYADSPVSFTSYDPAVGAFDIIQAGNNSWSVVLFNVLKYNAVQSMLEFWDTDKANQPMWFVLLKCYESTETINYAKNLYNLFIKINTTIQDGKDNMAFSWAINAQVKIDWCEGYVALYTPNCAGLIK